LKAPLRPAEFQYDRLRFHVAQLSEPLPKRLHAPARSGTLNHTNPRDFRLRLCSASERPDEGRATNQRNELPTPHETPRSTRMPEYQMAEPSAKAIAAPQSAEAREGRGRKEDCSSPPAQIPASAANAPGSPLEFWRRSGEGATGVAP